MSVVRQVQLPVHRPACASKEGRERSEEGRDEASTVEAAVSVVSSRRGEERMKRGKQVFIGVHFENKRERDAGKSLAGQRPQSRKGCALRRGLDEAQTASVTPRGAPHCPGAPQSGMGPSDFKRASRLEALSLGAMLRVGPSSTSGQEDRDRSIISCGHEACVLRSWWNSPRLYGNWTAT